MQSIECAHAVGRHLFLTVGSGRDMIQHQFLSERGLIFQMKF